MNFHSKTIYNFMEWVAVCIMFFTMLVPNTNAACGADFEKMRKRRIEAIRGQILSKLGLTQLPDKEPPVGAMTTELEKTYNRTRDFVMEQARQKREECEEQDEDYYAQDIETVYMKKARPPIQPGTAKNYKVNRMNRGVSEFFHFNLETYKLNRDSIVSASLRLYQVESFGTPSGARQQVQLYKLSRPESPGYSPGKSFLTMRSMDIYRKGWVSFDVTSTVKDWVESPANNQGLELTIPCSDEESSGLNTNSAGESKRLMIRFAGSSSLPRNDARRGDFNGEVMMPEYPPENNPHLVIMTRTPVAQSKSQNNGHSRRRKRSLDADYCFRRNPTETNCCLRELEIDFRRDLGWNWIHSPPRYRANFCGGACPYLWSMDSHHATILGLYRSMNPRASSAPCCAPKELEPLTIMYYNEGKFKITQMSDMILLSCTCT
ncbi:unnamed protein product [Clavelina lepadiformis]|uniref:TGF-beta family profile domain-containing protein n=1 Tax=Clavelina lepadiformis TaxID=159417 RepID=A0ABP0GLB9_CLALP